MAAKKSKKQTGAKKTPTTRKGTGTAANPPTNSGKNYTERELVLIDLALAAGAGLGKQVRRLPLAAVEFWADYFSHTVGLSLRAGNNWSASRKNARLVGLSMGRSAARMLRETTGSVTAKDGRGIAQAAQVRASKDPRCPKQGGAGKFC